MLYLALFIFVGAFLVILPFVLPTLILEGFSYALSLRMEDYDGWVYYGQVLTKYGKHFRAYEALAQATRMRPDRPEAWQQMGDLFSRLGQYAAAEKAYKFADESMAELGDFL
ncbi:MAG: hypothetical protein ACW99U_07325 [Candidatus Thorarchaeota archaeon]|jgi:tetratricopeptide (TPR) repeat protein